MKADFADDPDGDEDDLDDLLEESEDPWMREPAGMPCSSSAVHILWFVTVTMPTPHVSSPRHEGK